jgi:hypothetical protein
MAVTGKLYGKVFTALWNKEIDYDSDAIACTLHTSAYTPDQDVHADCRAVGSYPRHCCHSAPDRVPELGC